MSQVLALKVAQEFTIRGLIAYKLVAYKGNKCNFVLNIIIVGNVFGT